MLFDSKTGAVGLKLGVYDLFICIFFLSGTVICSGSFELFFPAVVILAGLWVCHYCLMGIQCSLSAS